MARRLRVVPPPPPPPGGGCAGFLVTTCTRRARRGRSPVSRFQTSRSWSTNEPHVLVRTEIDYVEAACAGRQVKYPNVQVDGAAALSLSV